MGRACVSVGWASPGATAPGARARMCPLRPRAAASPSRLSPRLISEPGPGGVCRRASQPSHRHAHYILLHSGRRAVPTPPRHPLSLCCLLSWVRDPGGGLLSDGARSECVVVCGAGHRRSVSVRRFSGRFSGRLSGRLCSCRSHRGWRGPGLCAPEGESGSCLSGRAGLGQPRAGFLRFPVKTFRFGPVKARF